MDLDQLETFVAVAKERGFSRAAEKLHRTQPAISQSVRKLEEETGEQLFDRSSHEGVLTDAGRVLFDYAERLLNLRGEASDALVELRQMQRGRLVIAANELTCLYLLPVLDQFRRLHPMVHVAVQRALASHIPDDVLKHTVEFGVIPFRPEHPQLRSTVVYRDELVFVVQPGHPLADAKNVSVKQLGAVDFVAHNVPSVYRKKVMEAFQRHHTPLNMGVELPTLEAIKKFVAMGNGVALIPGLCVEKELERRELVSVPLRDLRIERKLRLISRKGASHSHAALAFLRVAAQFAKNRERYLFQQEK